MAKSKPRKHIVFFLRVPDTRSNRALKAKVKAYTNLNGMTLTEWLLEAMNAYMTEQQKNPKFRRIVEGR